MYSRRQRKRADPAKPRRQRKRAADAIRPRRRRNLDNRRVKIGSAKDYGSFFGRMAGHVAGPLATAYPALSPIAGFAPAIGSRLGEMAGSLYKRLTGNGNYEIVSNSVLYPDQLIPSFGEDSIRIKKREFIANIDSSILFSNSSFNLNPGIAATFPWLAGIAQNYEQYHFNGLVFQLVSTCSDSISLTTNLGLGSVAVATDYDASDSPFVNMVQALSTMYSNTAKPSEDVMHAVECAPDQQAQKLYYVRSGAIPDNTDIRLYDLGNFQVCVERCPAVYTGMMQLWVSYDVTLCKSIAGAQVGSSILTDQYSLVTPSSANPFGSSRSLKFQSTLGSTISGTTFSFPKYVGSGCYLVLWRCFGLSTAVTIPSVVFTNCTRLQVFLNDTVVDVNNSGTTTGSMILGFIVRIDSANATFAFTGGVYPLPTTTGDLIVTQINNEPYQ